MKFFQWFICLLLSATTVFAFWLLFAFLPVLTIKIACYVASVACVAWALHRFMFQNKNAQY